MQCWWQLSRDGRQSRTQWNNAGGGCTPRCRPLSHSGWEWARHAPRTADLSDRSSHIRDFIHFEVDCPDKHVCSSTQYLGFPRAFVFRWSEKEVLYHPYFYSLLFHHCFRTSNLGRSKTYHEEMELNVRHCLGTVCTLMTLKSRIKLIECVGRL